MRTITFLRHGAYDKGSDVLNERGIFQTTEAIVTLKHVMTKPQIITSQGPRAQQTAAIIAKELEADFTVVDWLNRPTSEQEVDLAVVLKTINQVPLLTRPLLLVTNGEFIHEFIAKFTALRKLPNPLKPLVKGEVMLCKVSDRNVEVEYF